MKKSMMMTAALAAAMFVGQPAFAADSPAGSSPPAAGRDTAGGAGGAGAGAAPAAARPGGADRAGQPDQQNMDQLFVQEATVGNLYEIQLGQLAQQRAQSDEVRKLAQMLVQDHTQANQQLAQIAQSKKLTVPTDLDEVHKAKLAKKQQFQGQLFEKKYVIDQVACHVESVLKFRDASQNLQDPELKAFAAQTLPKLQQHLQQVQKMAGWTDAQTAGSKEGGHGAHSTTPGTSGDARDTGGSGATGAGGTARPGGGTGVGGAGTNGSGAGSPGSSGSGTTPGGTGGAGTGTGGAGTSGSGAERPGTPR